MRQAPEGACLLSFGARLRRLWECYGAGAGRVPYGLPASLSAARGKVFT